MLPSKKVIIKEINIIKFGKIENLSVAPTDGLNVIYGQNESGKSTIQLFLKAMLYGMSSRKKSGEVLKERERAIPWSGGKAEGVLTLDVDGRVIEIRRKFGKTSAGDNFDVCDALDGQKINVYDADTIGEKLLGVSADVFEKTLWIRQSGTFMGGRDDEISKKLLNMQSGGDETVSVAAALAKIEAERRSIEAKDKRNVKGKLDVLSDRLVQCRTKKYELASIIAQTESSKQRLNEARAELEKIDAEIKKLEEKYEKTLDAERNFAIAQRVRQIEECDKKLNSIYNNSDYQKGKDLTETLVKSAMETDRAIARKEIELAEYVAKSQTEENITRSGWKGLSAAWIGATLTALGIAATVGFGIGRAYVAMAAFLALAIIGVVVTAIGIRWMRALRIDAIERSADQEVVKANKRRLLTEVDTMKSELSKILTAYDVDDVSQLSYLYTRCEGLRESINSLNAAKVNFLGKETLEELRDRAVATNDDDIESVAELDARLKSKRSRHLELLSEVKDLDSKMAYEYKIDAIPSDIDTEINGINEEIAKYQRRLMVLEEAENTIKEAGNTWKSETLPQLSDGVNKIIATLTNNKYKGVRVSDEYKIRVLAESDLFDAEYLSYGTYDQMYLALRLSIANLLCEGKILFLDDILIAYDDERADAAIRLFEELSENWQILLFTCRGSDMEMATRHGAHTINI